MNPQLTSPAGERNGPRRLLLAIAATALLLSGCSSDGSDASRDGGSIATSSTTTAGSAAVASGPLERYADYESTNYDDPSHWVCRPDIDDDICDSGLDATAIDEDGTLTVEPFEAAEDPPIDCFYVYPTISGDTTTFADWDPSPDEEGYVTVNQAARLQSQCRLFAPVYRQITLAGLVDLLGGESEEVPDGGDPYADVLDAFRTYMANDNDGRGVVLIGHSQGASLLTELIANEFDPNEDVRDLLVGAYLAGTSVTVPEGEVVGGDFDEVPLCTSDGETACVTTWATFRSTAPPPEGSYFGAPSADEGEAGCVNPAAPAGGSAELDSYFPADASASILKALGAGGTEGAAWIDPDAGAGTIDTPFVHLTDLVTGACATEGNFDYLEATITGTGEGPRADDIPGDLSPEWGLHLVDVNLVMGDVVRSVEEQASTYDGG